MVPRQDLPQAIALNGVGMNIARSLGPALGGIDRRRGRRGGRLRGERRQLSRPDRRPPALAAGAPGPAAAAGVRSGPPWAPGIRFVAMSPSDPDGAVPRLRVRPRGQRGPGAHAARGPRPRRGRPGHLRPAARRLRGRGRRRRPVQRPHPSGLRHRGAGPPGLHRLCGLRGS